PVQTAGGTGASPAPRLHLQSPEPEQSTDHANALAEAFNSLFKAELIRNKGPWTGINDVEVAVAEYIDWFNQRRLHGELGHITPAEHEAAHYLAAEPPASLQKTS
ncbi:integrase core domain-containing protein, partial [Streptomyces sp. NPDC049910]|uniref:integrase core domain-containing protein n=1 Tax=Streptomyces sp. NPDC049910 TaxID=3155278 RepID=UPI003429256E